MVLGIIMLFAVGALLTSSMTEYRNAYRHQLGVTAFSLAESGIERAAHAIMSGDVLDWTKINSDTWEKTFTVARSDLGGSTGEYVVSVQKVDDNYTVISRSTVQQSNLSVRKGVKVEFVMSNSAVPGVARGLISLAEIKAQSIHDREQLKSQYVTVDSYKSSNNTAPDASSNRGNKAFIGTLSATDKFNVSNGYYYATLFSGNANNVIVNTVDNTTDDYLVSIDDLSTPTLELIQYKPSLVRTDVTFDWEFPLPPDAKTNDGWVQILPKDGDPNGQWKMGDFGQFDPKKNTSTISVIGSVATIGLTDTDKHYVAVKKLGVKTINIAGEVVIVIGETELDGLNINFVTPNAKLTIYSKPKMPSVEKLKTTQQMYYRGNVVDNWEAKRLQIVMLPKESNLDPTSMNPAEIQSHVRNEINSGKIDGNDVIIHDSKNSFVGQIFAPYSYAQLDGEINYCGSLFVKTHEVLGSCRLTFHYDASLEDSDDSEKTLSVSSWVEIVP